MTGQDYTLTLPNGIPLGMVYIKGGDFQMGGTKRDREQPIHTVTVPSFYLGRYPITNEQFVPFLNAKGNQKEEGYTWVNLEGSYQGVRCGVQQGANGFECVPGLEKHPMMFVTWYGASAYCSWLKELHKGDYRLPSEAEWEYSARGGENQSPFEFAGSNHLKEVGWYDENSLGETKPVGLKLPNVLGLYDMSGNVWEWCEDVSHNNIRVVRGGSWYFIDSRCRVSDRYGGITDGRSVDVGFRVARY